VGTKREPHTTVIHSLDEIPLFATEEEERAFWATHEVSDDLAAQTEPLPADIVMLLDQIRERRAQRDAMTHGRERALSPAPRGSSTRRR
jgi:hypothetical protein